MYVNRRGFLFGSAAVTALAGCNTSKRGLRPLKPGEKRTVALIGYGIQMRGPLVNAFLRLKEKVTIVAVCDCNRLRAEDGAKKVNKAYGKTSCRAVTDFRDVLKDPMIDMVCIATPDHWHAYIAVEAMKNGKDVYCEKPLTFNPDESKKVIAAQKKYDRVFQTGSMQRAWPEFRTACMIVRNGCIGDIKYVDANYGFKGKKLGGPSHPVRFFDEPANAAKESAPAPHIDWDMWLGPAKWRPYSDQLAPRGTKESYPMFWRFDDDLGTGYNGDWGAHHLDIAQWGLDMDKSGPYKIICSDEPHSTNLFHGGRRQYGMKMLFKKPYGDVELYHGPFGTWGTVFYGTKGIVAVNRGKIAVWEGPGVKPNAEIRKQISNSSFTGMKIVASSIGKDYGTDAVSKKDNKLDAALKKLDKIYGLSDPNKAKDQLYKTTSRCQVENFVQCVESRAETVSSAETGARGAVLCQLCNMSYVYDTGFDWDPQKLEVVGESRKLGLQLKRDYCRNGWEIVV